MNRNAHTLHSSSRRYIAWEAIDDVQRRETYLRLIARMDAVPRLLLHYRPRRRARAVEGTSSYANAATALRVRLTTLGHHGCPERRGVVLSRRVRSR